MMKKLWFVSQKRQETLLSSKASRLAVGST